MWCIYHDIVALEKPFHFGQFWFPFHGKCKDNWNKEIQIQCLSLSLPQAHLREKLFKVISSIRILYSLLGIVLILQSLEF